MAYSLQTLRSQKITSIHGRRLALDKDDFIVGPKDIRKQIEDDQSTAGSSFSPFGVTRILTTGSSQCGIYTLQAPVPGTRKRIVLTSSSTGCQLVKASGSALFYGCSVSTIGSTVINFLGRGAEVTLEAVSSIAWQLFGSMSSLVSSDHLNISFTTST